MTEIILLTIVMLVMGLVSMVWYSDKYLQELESQLEDDSDE